MPSAVFPPSGPCGRFSRELLTGAPVVIDDSIVGTLHPRPGGQWVKGFELESGAYSLRVETEDCQGISRPVVLEEGGSRRVVVMAEVEGGAPCRVRLW